MFGVRGGDAEIAGITSLLAAGGAVGRGTILLASYIALLLVLSG